MKHELKVRIYYEDTDAGGIVYHSNYLKYAERGRTEMLYALGIEHNNVVGLAVSRAKLKFKKPAVLGDELTVVTECKELNGASCDLTQNVYRDGELLVEIDITLVCVNEQIKPVRMPDKLKIVLEEDMKCLK